MVHRCTQDTMACFTGSGMTWQELTTFIAKEGMVVSNSGAVEVGNLVAFRWPEGWLTGSVVKRTRSKQHPWNVAYDDGVWPQLLADADRQDGSSAPAGSWVLLQDETASHVS